MTTTADPIITTQRPREAICPPWCSGHKDGYQSWDRLDSGEVFRHHASHNWPTVEPSTQALIAAKDSATVELFQMESPPSVLSAVEVSVIVGDGQADLTPAEARAHAASILEAADLAEAVMKTPIRDRLEPVTLMTAAEASKSLGLTPYAVLELCRDGRLKATKPDGVTWLIEATDVEAYELAH